MKQPFAAMGLCLLVNQPCTLVQEHLCDTAAVGQAYHQFFQVVEPGCTMCATSSCRLYRYVIWVLGGTHAWAQFSYLCYPCRARGGLEAERAERARVKEEAANRDRKNFEWLQQLRKEGFRKVCRVSWYSTNYSVAQQHVCSPHGSCNSPSAIAAPLGCAGPATA
eukprot:GHUV01041772.1.p1 GENE.GHUV01041772.1~~GHUV01041772.1.p1  ORF type:complete len:165 (-),score=28.57 GHUV01041772.1:169-663(-)